MNNALKGQIREITEVLKERNRKSYERLKCIREVCDTIKPDGDEEQQEDDSRRSGEFALVGVENG